MNNAATFDTEMLEVRNENTVHLPLGLLGFEQFKEFVLLANPEEAPFVWLQMLDAPGQAFLLIPPALILPEYEPELSDEDVSFLGLETPDEAMVFNIVTLRRAGGATVNLKGPIVVNRRTLVGKQSIPLNAGDYALQHPLPAFEPALPPC